MWDLAKEMALMKALELVSKTPSVEEVRHIRLMYWTHGAISGSELSISPLIQFTASLGGSHAS